MFHRVGTSLVVLVIATFASRLFGEDPLFSGPQVGETLPPLKVLTSTGESQVGEVDVVAEANGRPMLLFFQHEMTRPISALTRVLMNYSEMRLEDGLYPVMIRLTDDPSSSRGPRRRRSGGIVSGVSPDGAEGPGSYGLNRNVSVTIVVAQAGKVTASFALVQPSVTDAPKVIAEIAKLMGGDIPTTAELNFLMLDPRADARFRENGAAPRDPKLRQRICAVLRTPDDAAALDTAVTALESYIADDADKQHALGEASRLLLHQQYEGRAAVEADSPLGAKFSAWAEKYGQSR